MPFLIIIYNYHFQFNFGAVTELDEDLPKIDNPNIVTLSDENVVFNLIENIPLESDDHHIPISDIFLKPEPPDITDDIKNEGTVYSKIKSV